MKRGNWLIKLGGFAVLAAMIYRPAGADKSLVYTPHFEVSMPILEAPKLYSVTLPEELSPRRSDAEKALLPIDPDLSFEIKSDLLD